MDRSNHTFPGEQLRAGAALQGNVRDFWTDFSVLSIHGPPCIQTGYSNYATTIPGKIEQFFGCIFWMVSKIKKKENRFGLMVRVGPGGGRLSPPADSLMAALRRQPGKDSKDKTDHQALSRGSFPG